MQKVLLVIAMFCFCCALGQNQCGKKFGEFLMKKKEIYDRGDAEPCMTNYKIGQFLAGGDIESEKVLKPKLIEHVKTHHMSDIEPVYVCFLNLADQAKAEMNLGDICDMQIDEMHTNIRKKAEGEDVDALSFIRFLTNA